MTVDEWNSENAHTHGQSRSHGDAQRDALSASADTDSTEVSKDAQTARECADNEIIYGFEFCGKPDSTMLGETMFDCNGEPVGWIVANGVEVDCVHSADMSDSREKLETDMRAWNDSVCSFSDDELYAKVTEWLDRQAAITRAEDERICDTCRDEQVEALQEQVDELTAERDEWKAHAEQARESYLDAKHDRDAWHERYVNREGSSSVSRAAAVERLRECRYLSTSDLMCAVVGFGHEPHTGEQWRDALIDLLEDEPMDARRDNDGTCPIDDGTVSNHSKNAPTLSDLYGIFGGENVPETPDFAENPQKTEFKERESTPSDELPEGDAVELMRDCAAKQHGMGSLRDKLGIECAAGWQMRCLGKLADMVESDYVRKEDAAGYILSIAPAPGSTQGEDVAAGALREMIERDYVHREAYEDLRDEFVWSSTFLHRMARHCGTEDVPSLKAYVEQLEARVSELEAERDEWRDASGYACAMRDRSDARCGRLAVYLEELASDFSDMVSERDEWKEKAAGGHPGPSRADGFGNGSTGTEGE